MVRGHIERILNDASLEVETKLKVVVTLLMSIKDNNASVLSHMKHLVSDKELDNDTKFLVLKDLVSLEESTSPVSSPVSSSPVTKKIDCIDLSDDDDTLKKRKVSEVSDDDGKPLKKRKVSEVSDDDEVFEWKCTCQTCGSEFKQFNGEYRTLYNHREKCLAVPLDRNVIKDDFEKKSFRGGLNAKKNKELFSTFIVTRNLRRRKEKKGKL